MIDISPSRIELSKAKKYLDNMKLAKTLQEYEDSWKDLLTALDKAWTKAKLSCVGNSNFQSWQREFKNKRKKDPLLKYLKQARDADTHSIQEIVHKKPAKFTARLTSPLGGHIEHMEITDMGIVNYRGDEMEVRVFAPASVIAKTVINRSHATPVPDYHVGQLIVPKGDPIVMATKGIEWYEKYLNALSNKFN